MVLREAETLALEALVADGAAEEAALLAEGAAELTAALVELGAPPDEAGHAKSMALICHVVVVEEKPDQTIPVTAFPLAPAKLLNGMVTV